MHPERQKIALKWLYDYCGGKWFTEAVLDKTQNPDPSLPDLYDKTEIHSIFESLKKEDYILSVTNPAGKSCYILNETKESEWLAKIGKPENKPFIGNYIKKQADNLVSGFFSNFGGGLAAVALVEVGKYFFTH